MKKKEVQIVEVFIVYEKIYIDDIWSQYPQGQGIPVMRDIYSVRTTEDAAKEDVRLGGYNLDYCKQIVT